MPVTPADMTDEQHALIERLAHRCAHAAVPCEACTNLSIWAVAALIDTGWHNQITRYHNRTPQEQP